MGEIYKPLAALISCTNAPLHGYYWAEIWFWLGESWQAGYAGNLKGYQCGAISDKKLPALEWSKTYPYSLC